MNLITNAADAVGAAAGSITIATAPHEGGPGALEGSRIAGVEPAATYAALEVADTGCGMEPCTLARIFDPFFSTKGTGRGLGMSALLGIVRGHRGGLFVDSAPGRGTTVRVLLPAGPLSATAATTQSAPAPCAAPARATVLVVDDEPSVRRACQSMLRKLGLPVLAAGSGPEALDLVRANPGEVHLVVLDLSMPGMDGLTTLDALLALDPSLRIVLSSGFDEQALLGRGCTGRIAGFLQKPYTLADLRDALARAAQA